jgi:hypothetical protein
LCATLAASVFEAARVIVNRASRASICERGIEAVKLGGLFCRCGDGASAAGENILT